MKPQTFMNLSGEAVQQAVAFYKADPASQLIVLYDDISLEPGTIRIREKGSAGGHNGIKNIIQCWEMIIFCGSRSAQAASRRAGIWRTMCWDAFLPPFR